jgi:MscS family membrane protein
MEKRACVGLLVWLVSWTILAAGSGCAVTEPDTPIPPTAATTLTATSPGPTARDETPEPASPLATAEGSGGEGVGLIEVAASRTPAATATPGRLQQELYEVVRRAGLARVTFLGLTAADWASFGVSIIYVVAGYGAGTWLIRRALPRITRRTATSFDDALLQVIGGGLRWLVVIFVLYHATARLTFMSAGLKGVLRDAYFVLGLALTVRIILRLIQFADEWYRHRLAAEGREDELGPIITLLVRVGRVVVVLFAVAILLDWFGFDVTAVAAALGLGGLAVSLAAKETIADAIAGFMILVDRPFRLGDRIEIQGLNTWGDVVEIGLRTTRIRTRDNRMVIVPNAVISTNQVVNYTYPDPQYRVETHVGIGYGSDIEAVRRIIIDTLRQVEGVLPDKPVDALYNEMGDSAMVFRVRWWIVSYVDTRRMFDRVHTALQQALDAAGVDMPYPTQNFYLRVERGTAEQIAGALGGMRERGRFGDGSTPEDVVETGQ